MRTRIWEWGGGCGCREGEEGAREGRRGAVLEREMGLPLEFFLLSRVMTELSGDFLRSVVMDVAMGVSLGTESSRRALM